MYRTGDRFRQVHIGALALAAIMLPWSEFLLSIAQFLLIGNWLVEGVVRKDLAGRFKRAFTHPGGLVFLSFFALHALGLLWTEDLAWGLDLCRILLPVLAFAPVLVSSPRLTAGELRTVLLLGAWSTLVSTGVCLALKRDVIGDGGYRELSVFISHIRLALLLCFSIAVFALMRGRALWSRIAHGLAIGWCIFFLDRLGSLPGFIIVALMAVYGLWRWTASRRSSVRWTIRAALVFVPLITTAYVHWCVREFFREDGTDLSHLDARSAGANSTTTIGSGPCGRTGTTSGSTWRMANCSAHGSAAASARTSVSMGRGSRSVTRSSATWRAWACARIPSVRCRSGARTSGAWRTA